MKNTDCICTWIYLDSEDETSYYPQVGKNSHLFSFQKTYWKCVAVFFECSTRTNLGKRHILFSNQLLENFPEIEGFDLKGFLREKQVEVVTLPLTYQTPPGYFGRFRNQFYIFDILEFFEKNEGAGGILVLDSDCIITQSLDKLFAEINRCGLLALPMPFSQDYDINGLTLADMTRLYGDLDGQTPAKPATYFGGEIFAATCETALKINRLAKPLWQEMLRRHAAGLPKFNEEAHCLSYLFEKIGNYGDLSPFIKRIWTSPKYTNVGAADAALPIWHLPAEKTGGIALLFEKLRHRQFPSRELGAWLGVPRRTRFLNIKHFLKCSFLYRFFQG